MIPSQDNCDPDNPEEFALWAFVNLFPAGAPMLIHDMYIRDACRKLWARGFRHHPDLQTEVVEAGDTHWLGAQTSGVVMAAAAEAPVDLAKASHQQKVNVVEQLKSQGYLVDDEGSGLLAPTAVAASASDLITKKGTPRKTAPRKKSVE